MRHATYILCIYIYMRHATYIPILYVYASCDSESYLPLPDVIPRDSSGKPKACSAGD